MNPAVVADLEFIKDEVLDEIRPRRKRTDKSPQTMKHWPLNASQSLIVLSRDPVMTNEIPRESTFADWTVEG